MIRQYLTTVLPGSPQTDKGPSSRGSGNGANSPEARTEGAEEPAEEETAEEESYVPATGQGFFSFASEFVEGQDLLSALLNSLPLSHFSSLCLHGPTSCVAGCSLSGVLVLGVGGFCLFVFFGWLFACCLSGGLQPG